MASRQDIVRTIKQFQSDIEEVVASMPDAAWSGTVYENGWNARQILSHIASTSGVAGFILNLAQAPGPAGLPGAGGFDNEAFNRQQVELRSGRTVAEVLAEIRSNLQRDIGLVQATDDALINKRFKTPWETEGAVGDLIIRSFQEHLGMHLADLRSAADV